MTSDAPILVVDGDSGSAIRTARSLEACGYETVAQTGEPAERIALGESIACVVVDLDLPNRDGIAFAERIRTTRPDLGLVVYTDEGDEIAANRALAAGVDEYVPRALGPDALIAAVDRTIERTTELKGRLLDQFPWTRPGGLVVANGNDEIVYAEERAAAAFGLERTEIESRTCDELPWRATAVDGDGLPTPVDANVEDDLLFRRIRRTGEPVADVRLAVDSGDGCTFLSIDAAPLLRSENGSVVFSVTDVTDQVERERDLQRYRTIVETAGDMIYVVDADGVLTHVNYSFAGYLGRERQELIGVHISEIFSEDASETGDELVQTLLQTDETNQGRFEFRFERPDGETRYLENDISILDDDGTFHGSVGIIRDVTERRAQKKALERRNERLDEFATIVSHDLRNPLAVIKGKASLIRSTGDVEHLEGIESAADRMDSLLTDLLTLAREGQGVSDVEQVSLEAVANDAWRSVDTADATLVCDGDLGSLQADRGRLRQLFENLFRNAVEHGSTGSQNGARSDDSVEHGSTSSRAEPDDSVEHGSTSSRTGSDDSVERGARRVSANGDAARGSGSDETHRNEGGRSTAARVEEETVARRSDASHEGTDIASEGTELRYDAAEIEVGESETIAITVERTDEGFAVADDGPGIDPAVSGRVFDRGFTTAGDGTGYGLSIVQSIVDAHGWEISIDDAYDGGARFVVRI